MNLLTLEEVILVNYLLRGAEEGTEVLIQDRFRSEFARLQSEHSYGTPDYTKVADLTMLIVKSRPFPRANTLTGVAAGCISLMLNGYRFFLDKETIDDVVALLDTRTWTRDKLGEWFQKNAE